VDGWIAGYLIGGIVVVVVVVVLVMLIVWARRTARKAEGIAAGLRVARDRSAPLRRLDTTVASVERVRKAAGAARTSLTDRRPA
jgi:hypothetical protein